MATIAQLQGKVSIEGTDKAKDDLKGISGHLHDAAGGLGGFISSALSFAAGGAIFSAVGTAVGFVKDNLSDMISAGMDANTQMAILTEGLKSTHDASGMTAQGLDDLSTSIMNNSGIDDDAVKSAEQMLLTFTGLGKDVFPAATQAVADMATRMNGGAIPSAQQMNSVALQLGKALNDPAKGLTMLTREGVTFTDQQKAQIKAMEKAGDTAGAQKIMLAELNKEFGGSAAAAGHANGGIAILTAQFENMKQTVGQALIPVLTGLMGAVGPLVSGIGSALPGAIAAAQGLFQQWQPVLSAIVDGARTLGGLLLNALQPGLQTLAKGFSGLSGPGGDTKGLIADVMGLVKQAAPFVEELGQNFQQFAAFVVGSVLPAAQQLGGFFASSILPILSQLGGFLVADVLPAVQQLATFFLTKVLPAAEQVGAWFGAHVLPILIQLAAIITQDVLPTVEQIAAAIMTNLLPPLERLWNVVAPLLLPALQFLGTILKDVVGPAVSFVITLIGGLLNVVVGIVTVLANVLSAIGSFVGGVLGWFGNLFDSLVGHSIIPDLINGIISWFGQLPGKVLALAGQVVGNLLGALGDLRDKAVAKARDIATDLLGPKGLGGLPAKLLDFGKQLIQSLINGVQQMAGNLAGAFKNAIGGALNNLPGIGGIAQHFGFAGGGVVAEPVVGFGLRSGASYSFAETGPETVTPAGSSMAGGYGGVGVGGIPNVPININIAGRNVAQVLLPDLVFAARRSGALRI